LSFSGIDSGADSVIALREVVAGRAYYGIAFALSGQLKKIFGLGVA
jgi:hypothetical protein